MLHLRLRDPYERLVAMFRGDYNGYGGFSGWQRTFCDVDGAIKQKMEGILSGDDVLVENCNGGWWWEFGRVEMMSLKCFLCKNCLTGA